MTEHEKALGQFVTDAYTWFEDIKNQDKKSPEQLELLITIHTKQRAVILSAYAASETKSLNI